MDREAARIFIERVLEDFFGLGIAPIGHVDIRLRDRIDFIGIDGTDAGIADGSLGHRCTGVYILAGRPAEYRGSAQARRRRRAHDAVLEF